jgi:hypothetical protein
MCLTVLGMGIALTASACVNPPTPTLAAGCYDGVNPGVGDVYYNGSIDVLHNGTYGDTTDGTCQNLLGVQIPVTVILAANATAAGTKCSSIDPGTVPFYMQAQYGILPNYYYCYIP